MVRFGFRSIRRNFGRMFFRRNLKKIRGPKFAWFEGDMSKGYKINCSNLNIQNTETYKCSYWAFNLGLARYGVSVGKNLTKIPGIFHTLERFQIASYNLYDDNSLILYNLYSTVLSAP